MSASPLWALGRWWSWGWLHPRRSDNRTHWGLWRLQVPAACSQRSDRSTGGAGRTQTRSPEPVNRERTGGLLRVLWMSTDAGHLTHHALPYACSSTHYWAAVITLCPSKTNPSEKGEYSANCSCDRICQWFSITSKKKKEKNTVNPYLIIWEHQNIRETRVVH